MFSLWAAEARLCLLIKRCRNELCQKGNERPERKINERASVSRYALEPPRSLLVRAADSGQLLLRVCSKALGAPAVASSELSGTASHLDLTVGIDAISARLVTVIIAPHQE